MAQQNQTQYLEDYGKASTDATRFQIIGDNRVMLPIFASGSTYDTSMPPHHISSGAMASDLYTGGHRNATSNGESIFPYGKSASVLSPVAVRLGVSGTTGGNVLALLNEYGFVIGNQRLDAGIHYTYMASGEPVFQDTNATASQYGASDEQFLNNVAGTVSVSGSTVTGVGTTFLTASIGGAAGPYTGIYTPSLNNVVSGDLILITDGAVKYWHRIRTITDNLHLQIYPNWIGTGGGGKAYSIWRAGYGSYSRVVQIYNSNTGGTAPMSFFNYYVGGHRSTTFPGTIMAFTREASGSAASSHFTAPQNGAAQDIKAADIAYYKQFLLYGFGSTVSWSVAGFPTSFTTGFGATDFPATNVSAVAIDDQFVSFEYIGEQLIALFKNSLWEIQATGTVPEFAFYRIPEPIGVALQSVTSDQTGFLRFRRPSVSTRDSIFYNSHSGVLQLSGRTAATVSKPVRAFYPLLTNVTQETPGFCWEPSTNSVIITGPASLTVPSAVNDLGFMYNVDSDTWSMYDPANSTKISAGPIIRGTSTVPLVDSFCVFFYDGSANSISQLDSRAGAPYLASTTLNADAEWTTPVISMGDQYDGFKFVGFQLDGNFFAATCPWTVYGGKTPYALVARQSGTIDTKDNRQILGLKLDDPFIQFKFTLIGMITKINVYAEGFGK
jgi:hypothetical protein